MVQIKRGTIFRSEPAKIDSETTQAMPVRLDCRISSAIGDIGPERRCDAGSSRRD